MIPDDAMEAVEKVLDFHLPDAAHSSGCQLRCGYDGEDMSGHVAQHVLEAVAPFLQPENPVVEDASIEDAGAYPDGTVIVDNRGDAWQKAAGMWYLAVGGYIDDGPANYLPVTVLQVGMRPE